MGGVPRRDDGDMGRRKRGEVGDPCIDDLTSTGDAEVLEVVGDREGGRRLRLDMVRGIKPNGEQGQGGVGSL